MVPSISFLSGSQERSDKLRTYTSSTLSSTSSLKSYHDIDSRTTNPSLIRKAEDPEFERNLRSRHKEASAKIDHGKFLKAVTLFEGILSTLLERYGEHHERIGTAMHNVAVANLRAKRLSDARDAIEEALRIRQRVLGINDPKVGDSLVEYGIILLSMKKVDESLHAFEKALVVRKREASVNVGEGRKEAQLKLGKVLHNIGCVNFELGRLDEAKKAYAAAIKQQKLAFSFATGKSFLIQKSVDVNKPGLLTMASTMCCQGHIESEQNRFSDAIILFNESLGIQRRLLPADNKLTITTLQNIGYAYIQNDDFYRAEEIYQKLVKIQQESYNHDAQNLQKGWALSMKSLVYCQIQQSLLEKALKNLEHMDAFSSATYPAELEKSEDLQMTQTLIGVLSHHLKKKTTASFEFNKCLGIQGCRGCATSSTTISFEEVEVWSPKKPSSNGGKMSGHRINYA